MTQPSTTHPIDRETVLAKIREHKDELGAMKVQAVYLFGSVARGEATADSDIDLLVDIERPFSLFDVGGVLAYFEDLLDARVDVVPRNCLDPRIRDDVLGEAILAA
jgi:predicted nucleotidyltransferase